MVDQQSAKPFLVPLKFDRLRNDKLSLVPFESNFATHSKLYVQQSQKTPTAWAFLNYGPWASESEFEQWYNGVVRDNPQSLWFAIILNECTIRKKRREPATEGQLDEEIITVAQGTMAGVTGLAHADPTNSVVEIGNVLIFPQFQRTFVATTAHGLILEHLLNPAPDLHFRRVQWQANSRNQASARAAERLGFIFEGVMRWHRALLDHKESEWHSERESLRANTGVEATLPMTGPDGRRLAGGRHGMLYALCWDDWLDGGKARIEQLMARYDSQK